MKILVLGGTGAMGAHLVQMLAARGFQLVVTSRGDNTNVESVRYVKGNAQDINFVRSLLHQHWDAIVDFMIYTTSSFEARVRELLGATSQYVFVSTARVYANSEVPLTEESGRLLDMCTDRFFLSTDEYSLSKARQEDSLKRSGQSNWTIVRPYITYDTYRLQLGVLEKEEWLYRALRGRTIVFSRDIMSRATTMTRGVDVANGISSLVGDSKALANTFQVAAEVAIDWADVLAVYVKALKKHMGTEPKVVLQDLDAFLKAKKAKYQVLYDRLYDRRFDCSKIASMVRVHEFVDPRHGLLRAIEDFLRSPKFHRIDWKQEAIRDRQVGEWTPMSEIKGFKQKLKYLMFRLF